MNKILNNIKKLYLTFMIYAVIGWLYEVFLEVVIYRWGFTNRGVLFGPYCPVYGFGALLFIFLVYPMIKKKTIKNKLLMIPIVFLLCMFWATLLELLTSYICEMVMGSWPWQTYADYKYNFQARIALSPSIRFGIGGVIFLYILQPIIDKILNKISKNTLNKIFYTVGLIFIVDIIWLIVKIAL